MDVNYRATWGYLGFLIPMTTSLFIVGPLHAETVRDDMGLNQVTFHTFDIEELFSNSDGSIQFIELLETEGMDEQFEFMGKHVTSNLSDYIYPADLAGSSTANQRVLLATASFAILPGAVAPDFIIPENFFSINGDTISLRETSMGAPFDQFSFDAGEIPLDGVNSLSRDGATGTNSPTNLSGATGSIDLSVGIPATSTWGLIVLALGTLANGVLILRSANRVH